MQKRRLPSHDVDNSSDVESRKEKRNNGQVSEQGQSIDTSAKGFACVAPRHPSCGFRGIRKLGKHAAVQQRYARRIQHCELLSMRERPGNGVEDVFTALEYLSGENVPYAEFCFCRSSREVDF